MANERVQAIRTELAESSPSSRPAGVIASRPATETEQSGRTFLTRASATAAIGGIIIAGLSSGAYANLADTKVTTMGLVIGLVIAALGLGAFVEPGRSKLVIGSIIIVLAILSLPIAFGGLIVGAVASIVGGAMLISYEPPKGEVVVQTRRGNHIRRGVALLVDFLIVAVLHLVIGRFIPGVVNESAAGVPAASNTASVFISWILWWSLAVIVPSVVFRQTAGRAIMGLRLANESDGKRAGTSSVIIREAFRALISVGTFIVVGRMFSEVGFWWAMLALWVIVVAVGLSETRRVLDGISNSVSGQDMPVYTGNPLPKK